MFTELINTFSSYTFFKGELKSRNIKNTGTYIAILLLYVYFFTGIGKLGLTACILNICLYLSLLIFILLFVKIAFKYLKDASWNSRVDSRIIFTNLS